MSGISDAIDAINEAANAIGTVSAQVNTAVQNLVAIGQKLDSLLTNEIHTIVTSVQHLPDNLNHIINTDLPNVLAKIQGVTDNLGKILKFDLDATGITNFKNLLQVFFDTCGDILSHPIAALLQDAPLVKNQFKKLMTILAEGIADFAVAIVPVLTAVGDDIAAKAKDLAKAVVQLFQKIVKSVLESLLSALSSVSQFPNALYNGPLKCCGLVRDLYGWNSGEITSRIKQVKNSIEKLFTIIDGGQGVAIISGSVKQVAILFEGLISSDPANTLDSVLANFASGILFPADAFADILQSAANGSLWKWAELPGSFAAGDLAKWINEAGNYSTEGDKRVEREYRLRLFAVADAYLRESPSTTGLTSSLTLSDRRLCPAVVSDVIGMFINTTVTFILEPLGFVGNPKELRKFEDLGAKFASAIGRQTNLAIRASVGTLLRGVWVFGVHNSALIELIASGFATVFSSIAEGVSRNLTWCCELRSRYYDDAAIAHPTDAVIINTMTVTDGDNSERGKRIVYEILQRSGVGAGAIAALTQSLKSILGDYCAFLDMCYNDFESGGRLDAAGYPTTIYSFNATIAGAALTVTATARGQKPSPIIRVYVLGRVYVMSQYDIQGDDYHFTLHQALPYVPGGGAAVHIEGLGSDGALGSVNVIPH